MPTINVNGHSIHYQMSGSGAPLILLHGLGNNSKSFKYQLEGLKDDYTVIAWDAPGYGKSSDIKGLFRSFSEFSEVLNTFIHNLGYDKVNLLGHSMGAAIAVQFATKYPSKVNKLILADPTRGAAAISEEKNKQNLDTRIKSVEELSGEQLADRRVSNLLSPNAPRETIEYAKEIMAEVRPSGYQSVAYALYNLNQMDIYQEISADTLLICGEMDAVTPVKESKIIAEHIPSAQLEIIEDAGHLCYQEKPSNFNRIVLDFLNN